MTATVQDWEEVRIQLSETFLKFWDQADLVEILLRERKSSSAAVNDLLNSMQSTLDELRRCVDAASEAAAA